MIHSPTQKVGTVGILWDIENFWYRKNPELGNVHSRARYVSTAILRFLWKGNNLPDTSLSYVYLQKHQRHGEQWVTDLETILQRRGFRVEWTTEDAEKTLVADTQYALQRHLKLPRIVMILSGDGAVTPLLQMLQGQGCKVWVVSGKERVHRDLVEHADRFIPLEDLLPSQFLLA